MLRWVRSRAPDFSAQALTITYEGRCYYPCIHHTAVGQDRPVGRVETFREHRHNLYHIVVYVKARGAFTLDGQLNDSRPGTIVCVSPGQWHDFVTHRDRAVYSEVTFSFETPLGQFLDLSFEDLLQAYVGMSLSLKSWQHAGTERAHQLEALILQLTDHARSGSDVAAYCCQWSLARALDCLVWACTKFPESAANADERLVRIKLFIEQHYTEAISADELAHLAGISKGYLFRSFKRAFGQPPLAYQQELRLEAAKTLLRATSLRCHEIAFRCGYENNQYFHRLFKRATELTPRQYRDQGFHASPRE
jgi:AraC-like DNA-binding protein